tara:strand:- start:19377 stop:20636 length:1260 start_codon:yes stop_codon:yes gene_type:complete
MPSIYIQIASYRDPDLVNTISDLVKNSSGKNKLRVGVIDQYCEEDNFYDIEKDFKELKSKHSTLDYEKINYKDTKGVCWVRHLLNKKYKREKYTLQLDSHHRFIKDWDLVLIKMLKDLEKEGYKKPLLTTYCPAFIQQTGEKFSHATQMDFDRFTPEGALFFKSGLVPNWEEKELPVPSRFISGHMIFVDGKFCKEVVYDPYYLFHGEEINLTVRAYTHGYDLFHPHRPVVYHEYSRSHRPRKCWDDDPLWAQQNAKSHLRNRKFFQMDGEKKDIDFEEYDLGTERTIEDYEEYSGVSMTRRSVQEYTVNLEYPPNPVKKTDPNFKESFSPIFKHCIDLGFDQVPLNDYDFWVVAFHKNNGETIFREDLNEQQIQKVKSDPDGYCKIWKTFHSPKKPAYCIVWPHSKSKDWCEQIKINL